MMGMIMLLVIVHAAGVVMRPLYVRLLSKWLG